MKNKTYSLFAICHTHLSLKFVEKFGTVNPRAYRERRPIVLSKSGFSSEASYHGGSEGVRKRSFSEIIQPKKFSKNDDFLGRRTSDNDIQASTALDEYKEQGKEFLRRRLKYLPGNSKKCLVLMTNIFNSEKYIVP